MQKGTTTNMDSKTKLNREIRMRDFENQSDESMILEGYAAMYDQPTVLYKVDGIEYKEVIQRGAFDNTDFKDCCLKYNHSGDVPILARTRGDSLKINPDDRGLYFRAKLFDTNVARDVYKLVREGALDKASFAFNIAPNGDRYDRETRTRTITDIEKVWDCSIVDIPAYESTSVQARSFFELEREKELLESREREEQKKEIRRKLLKELIDETR